MKGFAVKTLLTAVFFCGSLSLFSAPVQSVKIEKVRIKAEFINSGNVSYSGSIPVSAPRSRTTNRWVMVAVEFTPSYYDRSGKNNKLSGVYENIYQRWLDNVSIRLRVLCESLGSNGRTEYALFSGSAQYWCIQLDNERHYALFFIPSTLIDRYYFPHRSLKTIRNGRHIRRAATPGNAVFKMSDPNDMKFEAVISVNNSKIAIAYANMKSKKLRQAEIEFNRLLNMVPSRSNLEGAVLSKGQSPWAFYKFNQFDLEKAPVR